MCSVTARTYSWKTICCAGVGQTTSAEPPQVGRAPGGPARIADIVPEQKRFEPKLGGLEITDGIFTSPAEVADGFIFDLGDIDRGEVTRAHQAGQLDGVTTVGFDAVAGLLGDQRGGDDPAVVAFLRQIAVEPVATGSGFIDKDEVFGFGLQLADELIDVTLAGADGAEVDDLGAVILGDIGHGNRVFVDIHADVECARLGHG